MTGSSGSTRPCRGPWDVLSHTECHKTTESALLETTTVVSPQPPWLIETKDGRNAKFLALAKRWEGFYALPSSSLAALRYLPNHANICMYMHLDRQIFRYEYTRWQIYGSTSLEATPKCAATRNIFWESASYPYQSTPLHSLLWPFLVPVGDRLSNNITK